MTVAAAELSTAIADLLADPETAPLGSRTAAEDRQHIAYGRPGIALLHIERAAAGLAPWHRAHAWLSAAARQPITSGADSHPFYGAPALAQALACAAEHLPGSYERALSTLDEQIVGDVLRRLAAAHRRFDAQQLPGIAEFDAIRGLAGYGAYLLRRNPGSAAVRMVLDYCVRLTEPITHDHETLPGWWTPTAPTGRPDADRFAKGHANSGMAHGIGAVLALLALAAQRGSVVEGHHDAMRRILTWFDRWRDETGRESAWPYWVTLPELRDDRRTAFAPLRPSWCYGTAGLARAHQLAALALEDVARQVDAENTLVAALSDPAQLKATTDPGLCHGTSGLAHLAARTAHDAHPSTAGQLRAVIPPLLNAICPPDVDPVPFATAIAANEGPGFLDGAAGIALAALAPASPRTSWDACLLIA